MKPYFWLILFLLHPFSILSQGQAEEKKEIDLKQSVVMIQGYQQNYDWLIPWNKKKLKKQEGSALVLPNQLLLTTADLVANHTFIEVRKPTDEQSYEAEIVLMDYSANLVILKVSSPHFWKNLIPIEWGTPEVGTASIQQWETRYEWKSIAVNVKNLFIGFRSSSQVHIPIMEGIATLKKRPPGNPIVKNGKVIGMTLQKHDSVVNILPSMFIQSFLERANLKTPYKGIPQRGFSWNTLSQNSARQYLKIDKKYNGILINQILFHGTGSEVLKPNDFLISIAGRNISNEGRIDHTKWGKIQFDFLFTTTLKDNETIALEVIREGKLLILETHLSNFPANQYSVPLKTVNEAPKYVLRGGLLFQELDMNYLELWGAEWKQKAPTRLSIYQQHESRLSKNKNHRFVFISRILPASINIGYQNLLYQNVIEVNGKPIHRLEDVVDAFRYPKNGFHQVHFLPGGNRSFLILPESELEKINQQILENYQIPQLQHL